MGKYCSQCGLQFRLWMYKTEYQICDECDPKKFQELHKENIRNHKYRMRGQQHITEHTFFPAEEPYPKKGKRNIYRREQK